MFLKDLSEAKLVPMFVLVCVIIFILIKSLKMKFDGCAWKTEMQEGEEQSQSVCNNFGQRLQTAMQLKMSDSTELPPHLFYTELIQAQ